MPPGYADVLLITPAWPTQLVADAPQTPHASLSCNVNNNDDRIPLSDNGEIGDQPPESGKPHA